MDTTADLTFLKTFTGGDPAKMKKYISMFLAAADPGLEAIRSNMISGDWPSVRTAAHNLKSQVKYMGIKDAETLAIAIEQSAANQTGLEKMPEEFEKLREITDRACAELRAEIAGL
jgi:HPt (histidine-containing phosphotransfer) domain-containing protein